MYSRFSSVFFLIPRIVTFSICVCVHTHALCLSVKYIHCPTLHKGSETNERAGITALYTRTVHTHPSVYLQTPSQPWDLDINRKITHPITKRTEERYNSFKHLLWWATLSWSVRGNNEGIPQSKNVKAKGKRHELSKKGQTLYRSFKTLFPWSFDQTYCSTRGEAEG